MLLTARRSKLSQVLRSFERPVRDSSGAYHARVVGRLAPDGMWEGWLEFVPLNSRRSRDALISAVESRQPECSHLEYWASGLTDVYVEGALARAKSPLAIRTRIVELPASEAPAVRVVVNPPEPSVPEPVLDPFEVASHSPNVLGQELSALGRSRLLNIIEAYTLNPSAADLAWMTDVQLVTFIVTAVGARLKVPRG